MAIEAAIRHAEDGDCIVILGKGDEPYQYREDGRQPWMGDNNAAREIVRRVMYEMNGEPEGQVSTCRHPAVKEAASPWSDADEEYREKRAERAIQDRAYGRAISKDYFEPEMTAARCRACSGFGKNLGVPGFCFCPAGFLGTLYHIYRSCRTALGSRFG